MYPQCLATAQGILHPQAVWLDEAIIVCSQERIDAAVFGAGRNEARQHR